MPNLLDCWNRHQRSPYFLFRLMTMPPQPVLEARNLRREAEDGTLLLCDVSLCLETGSSTAVVGHPGSGKSLLLRALCLLDPIQGGDVVYDGRPVADRDVPDFRRHVVLLQQRSVLIEGSVRSNLELPFTFLADRETPFDVDDAVRRLAQLDRPPEFLDRQVAELSGGESQIVALLRAVQMNPTVLLLDEPTSSLDQPTTAAFERLVTDWQAGSADRTILLVTHASDQADRLADRTVSMHQGRLFARSHGAAEDV